MCAISTSGVGSASNDVTEPVSGNLPESVQEALNGPEKHLWKPALDREKTSLQKRGVYTKVLLPKGKKAIKSKVVFKVKHHRVNGRWEVERYKCRWVCCGYSQKYGIDYTDTFAPVVSLTSVRILLALFVQLSLSTFQWDISTAFLYADLEEEVYVSQPKGLKEYDPETGQEYVLSLIHI